MRGGAAALVLAGLLAASSAAAQSLDSIPHRYPIANEFFIAPNAALSLCPRLVLGQTDLDPADFGLEEQAQFMGPDSITTPDRYFAARFADHTVLVHYDPAQFTCETKVSWTASSRMPTSRNIEQAIYRDKFYRLSQIGGRSEFEKMAPDGMSYWYYIIDRQDDFYSVTFMVER